MSDKFRWIIYLHSELGGGRFMRVTSIKDAKIELWVESQHSWHGDDLLCDVHQYSDEQWAEIEEDHANGCQAGIEPGLNSRRLSFGPRGGIKMEGF